jgi:AcrR family transcriptional regulator
MSQRMPATARRTQILEAAVRAILEHGVSGFRLRDVAAEAGVSQPLVSSHFRSRDELVLAAYEQSDERAIEAIEARVAGASSGRDALRKQLLACLDEQTDPTVADGFELGLELWRLAASIPGLREMVDKRHGAWRRRVADQIRGAIADGSSDPDVNVELTTLILDAVIGGLVLDVRWGHLDVTLATAAVDRVLADQLGPIDGTARPEAQ